MTWPTVITVSFTIFAICFGVSNWLFAMEYFTIANVMPHALKGKLITKQTLRMYERIKIGGVVLFVLTSVL